MRNIGNYIVQGRWKYILYNMKIPIPDENLSEVECAIWDEVWSKVEVIEDIEDFTKATVERKINEQYT